MALLAHTEFSCGVVGDSTQVPRNGEPGTGVIIAHAARRAGSAPQQMAALGAQVAVTKMSCGAATARMLSPIQRRCYHLARTLVMLARAHLCAPVCKVSQACARDVLVPQQGAAHFVT